MSLEDLSSDVLSDYGDYDAEPSPTDDEADYQELVHLHKSLWTFDHIYANNTIIDMQVGQVFHYTIKSLNFQSAKEEKQCFEIDLLQCEFEGWSGLEAYGSGLSPNQDYFAHYIDEVLFTLEADESDSDDSPPMSLQGLIQMFEAVLATSPGSSSDSSESTEEQAADSDVVAQDGEAGWQQ